MTPQEIFDKAVGGVIRQGSLGKGEENNVCRYRTKDGRACVVGQLIDDDLAHQWDNLCDPTFAAIEEHYPDEIPAELRPHTVMLRGLQQIHDDAAQTRDPMGYFVSGAKIIADFHDLAFNFDEVLS